MSEQDTAPIAFSVKLSENENVKTICDSIIDTANDIAASLEEFGTSIAIVQQYLYERYGVLMVAPSVAEATLKGLS